MKKKTTDPICRSFRHDFPEFVDRVKALGLTISLSPGKRPPGLDRAFFVDGYKQLTGFKYKADGSAFTYADAIANIDKFLTAVEADRAEMAQLSVRERFHRVMDELRKLEPKYRMIGEAQLPGGDTGHCFFNSYYDGGVRLHGLGDVASARADWRKGETSADQMARFCDMLRDDFLKRLDAEAIA